jgi:putative transposase
VPVGGLSGGRGADLSSGDVPLTLPALGQGQCSARYHAAVPEAAPIRKKLKRREPFNRSRFVTFSSYRRLPLLSNPRIAGLFVETLAHARAKHGFELFAWVVMPEHAHILARPREARMVPALVSIKVSLGMRVIARWRALRATILQRITLADGRARFWQPGGGFDRVVRDDAAFSRAVRYIHRNPVERGLALRAEDWRWSSVRWWMGRREGELACDPPPGRPGSWNLWKGYV